MISTLLLLLLTASHCALLCRGYETDSTDVESLGDDDEFLSADFIDEHLSVVDDNMHSVLYPNGSNVGASLSLLLSHFNSVLSLGIADTAAVATRFVSRISRIRNLLLSDGHADQDAKLIDALVTPTDPQPQVLQFACILLSRWPHGSACSERRASTLSRLFVVTLRNQPNAVAANRFAVYYQGLVSSLDERYLAPLACIFIDAIANYATDPNTGAFFCVRQALIKTSDAFLGRMSSDDVHLLSKRLTASAGLPPVTWTLVFRRELATIFRCEPSFFGKRIRAWLAPELEEHVAADYVIAAWVQVHFQSLPRCLQVHDYLCDSDSFQALRDHWDNRSQTDLPMALLGRLSFESRIVPHMMAHNQLFHYDLLLVTQRFKSRSDEELQTLARIHLTLMEILRIPYHVYLDTVIDTAPAWVQLQSEQVYGGLVVALARLSLPEEECRSSHDALPQAVQHLLPFGTRIPELSDHVQRNVFEVVLDTMPCIYRHCNFPTILVRTIRHQVVANGSGVVFRHALAAIPQLNEEQRKNFLHKMLKENWLSKKDARFKTLAFIVMNSLPLGVRSQLAKSEVSDQITELERLTPQGTKSPAAQNLVDQDCVICQMPMFGNDNDQDSGHFMIPHCSHVLHLTCAKQFQEKVHHGDVPSKCPICRTDLSNNEQFVVLA